MSIVISIPEEKLDELINKAVKKVKDQIIKELFKEIFEILKEILRVLNQLAEAQRRTEERLNQLVGEVARIRGELIEHRVISDLARILERYGFFVYSAPYKIREIDAIIEKDGFFVLVEICKTCRIDDIRQVIEGAKKFAKSEGIRPQALVIFSYTGDIDPEVYEEAEKKGIIVENNIRHLAKKLIQIEKNIPKS